MKRSTASTTIAISFLALLGAVTVFYIATGSLPTSHAKNDHKNCSLSSMKGSYGYTLTGFYSPSPGLNVPLGVVGTAIVSDNGAISNNDTLVINGVVTENRMYAGTITLNPDDPCSGKITYENGIKDNLVMMDSGEEVQIIQTAPQAPATALQAVVTGAGKKQSSSDPD